MSVFVVFDENCCNTTYKQFTMSSKVVGMCTSEENIFFDDFKIFEGFMALGIWPSPLWVEWTTTGLKEEAIYPHILSYTFLAFYTINADRRTQYTIVKQKLNAFVYLYLYLFVCVCFLDRPHRRIDVNSGYLYLRLKCANVLLKPSRSVAILFR